MLLVFLLLVLFSCILTPEVRKRLSIMAGLLTSSSGTSVFPKISVTHIACTV